MPRHGKKCDAPAECPPKDWRSSERHGVNSKMARSPQRQQNGRKHREAPDRTFPEFPSKCLARRNPVVIKRPLLPAGHDPSRQQDKNRHDGFKRQLALHAENGHTPAKREMPGEQSGRRRDESNSDPDQQALAIAPTPSLRLPRACRVRPIRSGGGCLLVLRFLSRPGTGLFKQGRASCRATRV